MEATPIQYRVDLSNTRNHSVKVDMQLNLPTTDPVEVFLPMMSPGSPGDSQNHPAQLSGLQAHDSTGQSLPLQPLDSGGWRLPAHVKGPLSLNYAIRADSLSDVRDYLTPEQAYLNGPDTLLCVKGHEHDTPSTIALTGLPDPGWQSSSTLPRVLAQPHTFYAASYDDAADDNIMAGHLQTASAQVGDTTLKVVQQGDAPYPHLAQPGTTPAQNLADFSRIYRAFQADLGPFPSERLISRGPRPEGVDSSDEYTVQKQYVQQGPDVSDGLEHFRGHELIRHVGSEAFIHDEFGGSARANEDCTMAHEVVHKVLAKLVQHEGIDAADLSKLHSTDGLWLTEGVTNWMGYKLELQSGLITPQQYLRRWEEATNAYYHDYAQNPCNARDDSLKAQQGDGKYYNKGMIVGLALDLELRQMSHGQRSLLDVLRELKSEFGGTGRYDTLEDIKRITEQVASPYPGGAQTIERIFDDHLVGRKRVEVNDYLAHAGLHLGERTDGWKPQDMQVPGARVVTDEQGRPGLVVEPGAKAGAFPLMIPSMGLRLTPSLGVNFVGLGSPAAQVGLHNYQSQQPEQVVLRTAQGEVDLRHPSNVEPGQVQALVFRFRKGEGLVEVAVPVTPASHTAIEELPGATPEQLSLRAGWLAQDPPSAT